jgi:hypothetical protein
VVNGYFFSVLLFHVLSKAVRAFVAIGLAITAANWEILFGADAAVVAFLAFNLISSALVANSHIAN